MKRDLNKTKWPAQTSIKSTLIGFLLQMLRSSVVEVTSYVCTNTIIFFNLVEEWQNIYFDFKECVDFLSL